MPVLFKIVAYWAKKDISSEFRITSEVKPHGGKYTKGGNEMLEQYWSGRYFWIIRNFRAFLLHINAIDNNPHRCYTALKFSPPATQGKHRVKRILYTVSNKNTHLADFETCVFRGYLRIHLS